MTDLICINDSYTEDYLKVFAKHNISFPKKNEIVTFLRVDNLIRIGKVGLIVAPYDGQFIKDTAHGVEMEKEVSFDKSRFVNLNGTEVTSEQIKEELNNLKKQKNEIEKF